MKKLLFLACTLVINLAVGQEIKFDPRTGDVEMDGFLKSINDEAKKDINAFTGNVVKTFGIVKTDVDKLLKDMLPGDVYMAAQVATSIGKPVTDVSVAYNKHKDKGWGAIAKELGIKPGSPEFHKLKKSMKANGNGPGSGEGKKEDKDDSGKGKGHGKGHGKK